MKPAEKRKRQHWKLSIDQIEALKDIRIPDDPQQPVLTIEQLAHKIGITTPQLSHPLRGSTDCSAESYRKIVRYIEKRKVQNGTSNE